MRVERKAKVLVVDDEENIRKTLRMILEYEGYLVLEASSGEEALSALEETVDVDLVFLDIKLPGRDGLEILSEIKAKPIPPEVVVISGQGTIQTAVEAQSRLRRECQDLRRKAEKRYELVGNHPLMKKLDKDILKTAPTNATVLIYGESGTGKELIARAIHDHSLRAKEPFIQVNCAAIPEELIESELFGHEKGAFTGATERKTGKFEQAEGGTIFLDEIGDMSLRTQSKVLRVLEEGEVQKVGSNKVVKVDVRVIAATNKDLKQAIQSGQFRDDLFFRLNVVPLISPALRDKKEDIPLLIEYFSKVFAEENNFRRKSFAPEALQVLIAYSWKGNVRELRNVVERLLIMSDHDTIGRADLPEYLRGESKPEPPRPSAVRTLKEFRDLSEREFILFKLKENGWNISRTARAINTPRSNLYKKLTQFGIKITAGVDEAVASSSPRGNEGEESPNSTGQDGR
jgi:two-component system nitrogen regulation response regulator NtrX